MSIPFGFGDILTISKLIWKLQRDFSSAPAEGRSLGEDLQLIQNCIASLEESLPRYRSSDKTRLEATLKPLIQLLEEIDEVSERYSSLDGGRKIWHRMTFPRAKIEYLRKQIHLRISAIHLFNAGLQNNSLLRIEKILEEMGGVQSRRFSRGEDGWEAILADLQRRGINREAAMRYKEPIEKHLMALSEVEEAGSQLETYEDTIGPENAVDQEIIVGPPTKAHLASPVCQAATALQDGKQNAIKQSKSFILRHFGACKYEIRCRRCQFHGFQDEPLRSKDRPFNTPLFFARRQEAPDSSDIEYYFDIQRANRDQRDGIWYRTIFFWKCHINTREPLLHTSARYQCVFCAPESTYGDAPHDKDSLLEHIRQNHIQTPPSMDLRVKFNVWVDTKPALYYKDLERLKVQNFDIMIPRAYGRTDRMRAEYAMQQAQV